MAAEGMQYLKKTFRAGADLSNSQFFQVKMSADDTIVIVAAATDIPIGVLQDKPKSGEAGSVCVIGDTKIVADAALSAGQQIGCSSAGRATHIVGGTDTTKYVVGQVTKGAANQGELAEACVNFATPHRAA